MSAQLEVDVVIPVKDRLTVKRCLETLQGQMAQVKGAQLKTLWLCDGGSQTPSCLQQLAAVESWPGVERVDLAAGSNNRGGSSAQPHYDPDFNQDFKLGFNKGWLLNQGLQRVRWQSLPRESSLVLISDVDILWSAPTLEAMILGAASHRDRLYTVRQVQESEPQGSAGETALMRSRYTYQLRHQPTTIQVKILAASQRSVRPGCGLLCAQLGLFRQLGGYRHCFTGWGWEDQDLLLRAELMGFRVVPVGQVVHLSHGDNWRQGDGQLSLQESRDRNICRCLAQLKAGHLAGDWPDLPADPAHVLTKAIEVCAPPELLEKS